MFGKTKTRNSSSSVYFNDQYKKTLLNVKVIKLCQLYNINTRYTLSLKNNCEKLSNDIGLQYFISFLHILKYPRVYATL